MSTMESDLGTRLQWIAVDHWDTDNPHTHVVLRGKDDQGRREQGSLDGIGPAVAALTHDGAIDLLRRQAGADSLQQRGLLVGRLQVLSRLGLAQQQGDGTWRLAVKAEPTLRAMGERGDILRALQRSLRGEQRDLALFDAGSGAIPVVGRIVAAGYRDELEERGYLVVDGIDGRAHYVPLGRVDPGEFPVGGIVEVRPTPRRAADRNIASLSDNGIYRIAAHRAQLQARGDPHPHSDEIVDAHVRRLEALRRAGIVEREAEGVWRIPPDLVARGHAYDRQRNGGVEVQVRSHLTVDRQATALGATWLDQRLVNDDAALANVGFGATVNEALRWRMDFLVTQGFAQRAEGRPKLPANLLTTLRQRELDAIAKSIAAETGLTHRPLVEGARTTGVYRRLVVTSSGRFAMLDDGLGFSLVPWRPALEPRIGQQLSALLRGGQVSWSLGRQRGLSR